MSLVAKSYCTSLSTHHLHSEVSWKIQSKSRPESTWEPAAGWPLKICHRHALSYLTVSYFCWDFWQKLIKFKHDKFFKKNLKYKHLLAKARKVGKESFTYQWLQSVSLSFSENNPIPSWLKVSGQLEIFHPSCITLQIASLSSDVSRWNTDLQIS